jgi:Fibronectin type III domain
LVRWGNATGVYYDSSIVTQKSAVIENLIRESGTLYVLVVPVDMSDNAATDSTEEQVTKIAGTIPAPTSLNSVWSTSTLKLTWAAPTPALSTDLVGYRITLTGTAGSRTWPTTEPKFDFTPEMNKAAALTTGSEYSKTGISVSVVAVSDSGAVSTALTGGPYANTFSHAVNHTAPTASGGLRAASASWSAITGAESYEVYTDPDNVAGGETLVDIVSGLNSSFLTAAGTKYVKYRPVNALGTVSDKYSDYSQITVSDVSSTDGTPPSAPTVLTGTGSGTYNEATNSFTYTLGWTPGADAQSGVDRYEVHYYIPAQAHKVAISTTTSVSIDGLLPNTTYTVDIYTVNGAGLRSATALSGSIVVAGDTTAPGVMPTPTVVWNGNAIDDVVHGTSRL